MLSLNPFPKYSLLGFLLSLTLSFSISCSKKGGEPAPDPSQAEEIKALGASPTSTSNSKTENPPAASNNSFYDYRDIFSSYAKNVYGYTDEQVTDLVYPPSKSMIEMFQLPKASSDRPLDEVRQVIKAQKPSTVRSEGLKVPWKNYSLAELESSFAKSGPVTILLFVGVTTEIAKSPCWEDVFEARKYSSLTRKFAQNLAASPQNENAYDTVYSELKQGPELHPLSDIIKAASFDDDNGKPLVNLILFHALFGSMESFSTISENNVELLRRTGKVFNILGETPNTIYLLGHSRGATLALDYVVEARKNPDKYPWASKIGGVISLAGVSFGTDLADAAYPMEEKSENDKRFLEKLVERMKKMETDLQPFEDGDSDATKRKKVADNGKAIASTGYDLGKVGLGIDYSSLKQPGQKKENLNTQLPNIGSLLLTGKGYAFDLLSVSHPFSEYSDNIRRYKDASRRYIDAFGGLSTKARLEWWKTHPIPKDIKLISLPTTQYDITDENSEPSPLLYKPYIVDATSSDYGGMRNAYYFMYELSGLELNDGLVPFDRAVMWPKLVTFYNPDFPVKNIYFAGIHSANHGAVGQPIAIESKDKKPDPFPRPLMLRSIGTFISRIIAQGN